MSDFYFDAPKIRRAHESIKNALVVKGVTNAALGFVWSAYLIEAVTGASNNKEWGFVASILCMGISFGAGEGASQYLSRLQITDIRKLILTDKSVAKKMKGWYVSEQPNENKHLTVFNLVNPDRRRFNFSSFAAGFTAPLAPAMSYITLIKGTHIVPDSLLPMAIILPAAVCGLLIRSARRRYIDTNDFAKRLSLPSP